MARVGVPQLAKYELLEELGHGGMATVYRARDRRLGREVAVKVIHPHLRDSRRSCSRFHAEAKAVAKLRHPNIVEVYDVSEPDEADQYLVVALVRGTTLRKLLQERGAMPPEIAAAVALELLAALAHANATRRRPPRREARERPRRAPPAGSPARRGDRRAAPRARPARRVVGEADRLRHRQAPRRAGRDLDRAGARQPRAHGARADRGRRGRRARPMSSASACSLYECMVGHLPFDGANPAQVLRRVLDGEYPEAQRERPVVGVAWSSILDRALAHAPADRFPDANAMRDAFAAELQRLDVDLPGARSRGVDRRPGELRASATARRIVERLCALAGEARKRGDVLSAAADYNRALAHAPDDPNLLRIVAGMNRAERRSARAPSGRAVGAVVDRARCAGAGVRRGSCTARPSAARARDPTSPASSSGDRDVPSALVVALARPPPPTPRPQHARARRRRPPRAAPADRRAPGDPRPEAAHGRVRVDRRAAGRDVSTGDTLTLGCEGPHAGVLVLGVRPVELAVEPGEKDSTLVVSCPSSRPPSWSTETSLGRTSSSSIRSSPFVPERTPCLCRSAYEPVTVKQIETGDTVSVRLEAAKTVHATFR